ncbi:MAG: hypothetical protein K2Q26_10055 [Bdellovibrionales bacterium]|nr:hypothetical protein [Bdellovibrionales bacterium]
MRLISTLLFAFLSACSSTPNTWTKTPLTLQPESERPKLFFISEPTNTDGSPLDEIFYRAAANITQAIVESLGEDQKLVFVGSPLVFRRFQQELGLSKNEKFILISSQPYYWLQDLFEVYKTPKGETIFGVPYVNSEQLSAAQNIAKALNSRAVVIDAPSKKKSPPTKPGFETGEAVHGVVGGNIEKWTPQVGFVGLSDFQDREHALEFSELIFSPTDRREVLPTQWLYLGHIDEVVKPILFENINGSQCKITALIADPQKALDYILQHPNEFIHDPKNFENKKFKDILVFGDLCKNLKTEKCENMRWKHFTQSTYFKNEFKAVQQLISQELSETKKRISQTIHLASPCEIQWIEVPNLYLANLTPDHKIERRSARPLFPNLTNGLVVGNSYVVLDPGSRYLRNSLKKDLEGVHLKTRFVESGEALHNGGLSDGYIHCMTQVLR